MIPRALNAPLSWIGLMRVSEHEAELARLNGQLFDATTERSNILTKFKRAATDLAAQSVKAADLAVEVEKLRTELVARKRLAELQGAVMEKLRPDAEAMRRKRANDAAAARLKRRGNK